MSADSPTRLIIHGAKGRMGRALIACAGRLPDARVVAEVDQGDSLEAVIDQADVVVDFTLHHVVPGVARLCAARGKPLVSGTTGLSEEERAALTEAARAVPIVWASNFSTGVNTLFWLTRKAAEILGPAFDLEIVEMHHRLKKDAPSGTAASLARILAEARGWSLAETARHGREGVIGERPAREIGIHALRGGDVVGDHTVIFAGVGERLELTHRASSRETFAQGALRAALWVRQQPPGLYDMQDVLGLKG
ncbi:MAG: 4-hydroxy-tetrahydrodipicolinate reductase [Verrucomicrobia bacterium]|nr:MAG: 4-hydroxy-tetrahydrodipicolinate reductase [Verrucomicrobiota bacterium]